MRAAASKAWQAGCVSTAEWTDRWWRQLQLFQVSHSDGEAASNSRAAMKASVSSLTAPPPPDPPKKLNK